MGIKQHILDTAGSVVTGARRGAYGEPEDNFQRIALFWRAYFENTGRPEAAITAGDVSPLMRLMKEARLCETPDHLDSHVDIVGYALTGAEVSGVEAPCFSEYGHYGENNPPLDGRSLRRNTYYDSEEFRARWHSRETLESIALDLDVTPRAVEKAAKRRGFTQKKEARKETDNER